MKRAIALLAALSLSCVHRLERKVGPTLQTVDATAPFLKIHMRNGDLYVLSHWTVDDNLHGVVVNGVHYGPARRTEVAARYAIKIEDVALFETNTVVSSPSIAAMAVVTGLSVAVTVACIANPKACFGSCPTFYAIDDATGKPVLQAEGFSDAIAPQLETHDIDALWRTTGRDGRVTLRMTNEAYETHVVKQADLLVVPRPRGGRVLATPDKLYVASSIQPPIRCDAAEGSCLDQVRAVDGVERTSLTDPDDLAARETIDLGFAPAGGRLGIAVASRQTLVTTFLLYQGLAYLGTTATGWLTTLGRGSGDGLAKLLGGIEVQLQGADGAWQTVDEIYETGPLATDVHLALLPANARAEHVRLRGPMGGWRTAAIALATNTGEATPIGVAPDYIHGTIGPDYAAGRAAATAFPIVTMPGDAYELSYKLPPGDDYELFLDSRGYYLEWMREAWIREENPLAAVKMMVDPAGAMRDFAPAYKKLEPQAEALFWSSRYAHP